MRRIILLVLCLLLMLGACGQAPVEPLPTFTPIPEILIPEATPAPTPTPPPTPVPSPTSEPEQFPDIEISYLDTELVRIADFAPEIFIDLRYATEENFTGEIIYGFDDAYIRYGTLQKLLSVQESLSAQGYSLLIWDAYRPQEAQFALWEVVPDANFVANPYTGHSGHSNGGTVDISLVYADGSSVEMPSAFDEFSALANRDYSDVSAAAAANSTLLESTMKSAGFGAYWNEWWHYTDNTAYPFDDVECISIPAKFAKIYTAKCDEFINLRTAPEYGAESIIQIPTGAEMLFLAYTGKFIHVQYGSYHGYVAAAYTEIKGEQL